MLPTLRYLAATIWGLVLLAALAISLILLALPLLAVAQTPVPVHDPSRWHAPGFGHEHGDAPYDDDNQWVHDNPVIWPYWAPAGQIGFNGPWNTSKIENTLKNPGMKGTRLEGVDVNGRPVRAYIVQHLLSDAMDRQSQYHSQQVWVRDADGGLTVRVGWVNFGSVDTARVPARCTLSTGGEDCDQYNAFQRPVVFVVDQATLDGDPAKGRRPIGSEQWYGVGNGFALAVNINTTTVTLPGERATDTDPHRWHLTGAAGEDRDIELRAKAPIYNGVRFSGAFWVTQFGEWCNGPGDPGCPLALLQYISPTYNGIVASKRTAQPVPPGFEGLN